LKILIPIFSFKIDQNISEKKILQNDIFLKIRNDKKKSLQE